jgi:hypothetical protein
MSKQRPLTSKIGVCILTFLRLAKKNNLEYIHLSDYIVYVKRQKLIIIFTSNPSLKEKRIVENILDLTIRIKVLDTESKIREFFK